MKKLILLIAVVAMALTSVAQEVTTESRTEIDSLGKRRHIVDIKLFGEFPEAETEIIQVGDTTRGFPFLNTKGYGLVVGADYRNYYEAVFAYIGVEFQYFSIGAGFSTERDGLVEVTLKLPTKINNLSVFAGISTVIDYRDSIAYDIGDYVDGELQMQFKHESWYNFSPNLIAGLEYQAWDFIYIKPYVAVISPKNFEDFSNFSWGVKLNFGIPQIAPWNQGKYNSRE